MISTTINAMSQTNVPWGTRRSKLLGLSAACYLLPALVDQAYGRKFLWAAQAVACFWCVCFQKCGSYRPQLFRSDFIDTGKRAMSHAIDKVLATSMVAYVAWFAFTSRGVLFVVAMASPPLAAYVLGTRARRRGCFKSYTYYHSLWHLIGGLVAAYALLQKRKPIS